MFTYIDLLCYPRKGKGGCKIRVASNFVGSFDHNVSPGEGWDFTMYLKEW